MRQSLIRLLLSKVSTCVQGVASLSTFSTNMIRSYAIDAAEDHSNCMSNLALVSIYVLIDLTATGFTIDGGNPEWNAGLYNRYTRVIDAMQSDTFGFLVGDDIAGSQLRSELSFQQYILFRFPYPYLCESSDYSAPNPFYRLSGGWCGQSLPKPGRGCIRSHLRARPMEA